MRAEQGLSPLKIVVVSLLQPKGMVEKISSTDSRALLQDLLGADRFKLLQSTKAFQSLLFGNRPPPSASKSRPDEFGGQLGLPFPSGAAP